jgi:hypothetical protein
MRKQKEAKPISDELIDGLLKQGRKAEDIQGLLKQITKAVLERALQGEMTEHLGYDKHDPAGNHSGNSRNGVTQDVERRIWRDRTGNGARPERRVCPATDTEESNALERLRRKDSVAIRERHDDARDPRPFAGDVSGGGKPEPDQRSTGGRDRAGADLAEPTAGTVLRHRIPGRTVRKDAARRSRREPRCVCSVGNSLGREERHFGPLDFIFGRSEVLDERIVGVAQPWCEGHLSGVRGWLKGLPASD